MASEYVDVDYESQPFLDEEKRLGKGVQEVQNLRPNTFSTTRGWGWKVFFMHGLAFLAYSSVFAYLLWIKPTSCRTESLIYSPAAGAIEYERRVADGEPGETKFTGKPSPESDAAWGDLLRGVNLRVTGEEFDKLGETSLAFRDGSGYLGTLGVYHELHCIKRLRRWFYRDYYYGNMSEAEHHHREEHAEHCLEYIRQASICHGDIALTPFEWLHDAQGNVIEPTTKAGTLHQCVNWERLSAWAKSRRVDVYDPNLFVPESHA